MRSLNEVLQGAFKIARQSHDERVKRWRADVGAEKVREFLAREYGQGLAAQVPDISLEEFLAGSRDEEIAWNARRASQCTSCRAEQPKCESVSDEELPGRTPCWDHEKRELTTRICEPWKALLLRNRLIACGVGKALATATLDNFDTHKRVRSIAAARAKQYLQDGQFQCGATLAIEGRSVGVGKTHLAVAVMAEALRTRLARSALFLNVPKWLDAIRRNPEDLERNVTVAGDVDLLVLDDLGAQRTTGWVREQVYIVANERWSNARATIVTTNCKESVYRETLGAAATSRLFGRVHGIKLEGQDRR